MHISTARVVMYFISVASETIIENTDSNQILAQNVSVTLPEVTGNILSVSFTILHI